MSAFRQTLRAALALLVPHRWLIVRGPAVGSRVYLTFDDGPHPEHTPRVLDALARAALPATFFVIGAHAQRHPDLLRRIHREGHRIGHHSYTHSDPATTSARQLRAELHQTDRLFDELLGVRSTLIRPPKGELTAAKVLALWRAQRTIVLWSIDPRDYRQRAAADLAAALRTQPLRPGDVLLLHDAQPHTAAVLPDLAAMLRDSGLTASLLPDPRTCTSAAVCQAGAA